MLSVADHCGCLDMCGWLATSTRPGMNHLYLSGGGWEPLIRAVRALRPEVGILIVSVHWGPNFLDEPASWQRDLAHALIDAGADVIHGHSAHHPLPVERYRGKHIFYALGDLVNDYGPVSGHRIELGAVAELTFDRSGAQTLRAHPHRIRTGQPRPLDHGDPDHELVLRQLGLPTQAAGAR